MICVYQEKTQRYEHRWKEKTICRWRQRLEWWGCMPTNTRNGQRPSEAGRGKEGFFPRALKGTQPCQHHDFRFPASWIVREFLLFWISKCMMLCYTALENEYISISGTAHAVLLSWGPPHLAVTGLGTYVHELWRCPLVVMSPSCLSGSPAQLDPLIGTNSCWVPLYARPWARPRRHNHKQRYSSSLPGIMVLWELVIH